MLMSTSHGVGGVIPSFSCPYVELSLGLALNPTLVPAAAPRLAATPSENQLCKVLSVN